MLIFANVAKQISHGFVYVYICIRAEAGTLHKLGRQPTTKLHLQTSSPSSLLLLLLLLILLETASHYMALVGLELNM